MARHFVLAFVLLLSGIVAMGCEGLATDTPPLPVADTGVPEEPGVNGCGGEGELSFGVGEAQPGEECGLCQDGVLFCTGPDALACGAPSPPNGCGGCGLLEGEPGATCGLCDDGQWSCGGGKVSCIGESQSNSCGGCEPLAATPGELCLLGTGEDGLTICVGRASTACVSLGRNLCGGASALELPVGITGVEPRPGARYDDGCRAGVLYCEGEALAALDVRVPNACGGCVPLLGEPGTSCNACGAAWSCAEDGSVACVGPKVNACGGCTELPSSLGASCGAEGGRVSCIGTEALGCAIPGISNACGGLAQLTGPALGSACGECSDGVVVCDTSDASRGRTICASARAANACGGCATLEAPPGGRCGTCGTGRLACSATGADIVCDGDLGDAAKNACGGCGALSPAVGVACGRCGTTGCDDSLAGQVRCVEPAAGCAAAAVCGNGTVEAGESCDDGNQLAESCEYGLQSCSVCGAACQALAGATSYCGDRFLVAGEECDDGDAIETNGCTSLCRCGTGFHAESGFCRADVRPCLLPNATLAFERWNGATYADCTASRCDTGYAVVAGRCFQDTPQPLGAACTDNAECESGSCSTSPDGVSNDRCAPAEMNFVPAGSFTMGSPLTELGRDTDETEHLVTLTRAFFVDQTETTQARWMGVSGGVNGSYFQDATCVDGTCLPNVNANPDGPAEQVDWYAALGYANARSEAESLPLCYELLGCSDPANGWKDGRHEGCTGANAVGAGCLGYRLPSEAEWEFAARGGIAAATYGGDLLTITGCATLSGAAGLPAGTPLSSVGVYACNAGNRSMTVRSGAANGFGLYDMLGNVWEWTSDSYGTEFTGITDPSPVPIDTRVVNRGGSWYSTAAYVRAAFRNAPEPATRFASFGVRLVRSVVRSCSLANATAATQTWNSATSAYGSCTATACASGYTVSAGACVVASVYSLGTACTLDAECASGFCATGPVGTANDRCAPEGMNYIPAGTFTMGSPLSESGRVADEVEHSVTLTRSFFLGQTEVTQGQWKALLGGVNSSYFQSTTGTAQTTSNANDSGPVEYLDWYAAVAFANARSAAEGLTSCYTLTGCADDTNGWQDGLHAGCTDAYFVGPACTGYRLPTESEWEYAARGGTTTATYLGNLSGTVTDCTTVQANLDGIAWWCLNSGSRTQAVGLKSANSFGLYDMLGNVWEWTGDRYGTYPGTVTDPTGPTTGSYRVNRGGSWYDIARSARAAFRNGNAPGNRDSNLGFRLVRTAR